MGFEAMNINNVGDSQFWNTLMAIGRYADESGMLLRISTEHNPKP